MIVLSDHGHISGRATQLAISSFNGIAEAGLDVVFVSGVGPVDSVIKRDIVDVVNFGLHDLLENPSRIQAFVRGVWDSRCADRLRDVLAECDPADTIVYRHSWMKSLSSPVVQAASRVRFRVGCTLHDYFSICPNGGLYNFPQQTAREGQGVESVSQAIWIYSFVNSLRGNVNFSTEEFVFILLYAVNRRSSPDPKLSSAISPEYAR